MDANMDLYLFVLTNTNNNSYYYYRTNLLQIKKLYELK